MNEALERYLNDHHAGSCGAVKLVQELAERQDEELERQFFLHLKAKIESDQETLRNLLATAGLEKSTTLAVVGSLSEGASRLKLLWEGLEPGKLGMLEALDVLALGIQGKRLLWAMLAKIAPFHPEWHHHDFAALEQTAISQRDQVEERRLRHGFNVLVEAPAPVSQPPP